MSAPLICVIEDEEVIAGAVAARLRAEGFGVEVAHDGLAGVALCDRVRPDLVVLDLMLPELDGLEVCRRVQRDRPVPVLMLTARDDETDVLVGLGVGADDYMTKPFSTRELVARIKAVLRRSAQERVEGEAIEIDGLRIDTKTHRVLARGVPLLLSPTEFRLLHFFIAHPERVYTRSQLLDQVWGSDVYIEERTVDVHIRRLRKTLAPHRYDHMIQTVRSVGYRFSNQ
jgi:two-component system phosphate regulon response regulator PhoB